MAGATAPDFVGGLTFLALPKAPSIWTMPTSRQAATEVMGGPSRRTLTPIKGPTSPMRAASTVPAKPSHTCALKPYVRACEGLEVPEPETGRDEPTNLVVVGPVDVDARLGVLGGIQEVGYSIWHSPDPLPRQGSWAMPLSSRSMFIRG